MTPPFSKRTAVTTTTITRNNFKASPMHALHRGFLYPSVLSCVAFTYTSSPAKRRAQVLYAGLRAHRADSR